MIKGLVPSLAEGGKIKIGGLGEVREGRSGPYRLPVKWDHFQITGTQRKGGDRLGDLEIDQPVMAALAAAGYADQDGRVRTIPIVLHSDLIEEVFPTCYAAYAGRKLVCRGNGESATRYEIQDGQRTGRQKEIDCPCEFLDSGRCKPNGALHCSLRVPGLAVAGAVHRWRTTSIISIQQMTGSLTQILATVGILQGLPLVLRVLPMQVNPPDGAPSTVYVCHCELRGKDLPSIQRQALELAQLRQTIQLQGSGLQESYRAMLQAPGDEDEEEAELISAEFYPEEEPAPAAPPAPEQNATLERLRAMAQNSQPPVPARPPAAVPDPVGHSEPGSAAPPRTQAREPEGTGGDDPPMKGRKRRTCSACGFMKYGVRDRLCPGCYAAAASQAPPGAAAAPPAPPAEPEPGVTQIPCSRCGELRWPVQLTDGHCSECQIVLAANRNLGTEPAGHSCAGCGVVKPDVPSPGGKCRECSVKGMEEQRQSKAPPRPPSRPRVPGDAAPPAPRDGQPAYDRFVQALQDGVTGGAFDGSQAIEAIGESYPDLPEDPAQWTEELANGVIAIMKTLEA